MSELLGMRELFVAGVAVISSIWLLSRAWRLLSPSYVGDVLVLKKCFVDPLDPDDVWVHLSGRSSGIFAWLRVLVGLGDQTIFRVTKEGVSLSRASFNGECISNVPLEHICSTECSYRKPIWLLLLCGGLLLFAVIRFLFWSGYDEFPGIKLPPGSVAALAAIIPLIAYSLAKTFQIKVQTGGGKELCVSFRRSVIENVALEFGLAQEVIRVINDKVRDAARPVRA